MGNKNVKQESNVTPKIDLDNDDKKLELDKCRFNDRLRLLDPRLEIIDQIKQGDSDVFILSVESVNYYMRIINLLTVEMSGEINPLQFGVEKIHYKMEVPNWPNKTERTTVAIRRIALKKIGKVVFLRGFAKLIMTLIATYISFLLWSINR